MAGKLRTDTVRCLSARHPATLPLSIMLTKLLLTALVFIGALVYARHKGARRTGAPSARSPQQPPPWYVRMIPAALLLALLAVAALTLWLHWQDAHRIFTARVIDTRSGEVRTYAVYRNDVEGRHFTTVDGREITLADVERLELVEGQPPEKAP